MNSTAARAGFQLALAMRIGGGCYALPLEWIEEVLPALPIESIPECPDYVRGVVFVRGRLIPVLNAAERLNLSKHSQPLEPHIVCLRWGEQIIGLEVDEALDLIEAPDAPSLPVESLNLRRGFLTGLVEQDGQIIRLLDAQHLLAADEATAVKSLAQTM